MNICGKCGFKNSDLKNYCDHCGTLLGRGIPPAGRLDARTPTPLPENAYTPLPAEPTGIVFARLSRKDKRNNLLLLLPVLAVAAIAATLYHNYHIPTKAVLRTTIRYLEALQHRDLEAAYSLLSQESKDQCSLEEFRGQQEEEPWNWSEPRIASLEPETAVVQYRLFPQSQEPSTGFLFLLLEKNRWVRPYNGNLLKKAEAALDQNNPELALIVSQAAARINPRDPAAQGYLCEAIYHYRQAPRETEKACSLALNLSRTYPSALSPKSLCHLHAILADTYKNSAGKYAEAIREYDSLLAFKDLSANDRCNILLAQADALIALGNQPQARKDLDAAAGLCVKLEDLEYIETPKGRRRDLMPLDL